MPEPRTINDDRSITNGQTSLSRLLLATTFIAIALFMVRMALSERISGSSSVRVSEAAVILMWLAIAIVSAALGSLAYGWKGFCYAFAITLVIPPLAIVLYVKLF